MDERQSVDRDVAVASAPAEVPWDRWLDIALEDSFPASDPIASHVFD